MTIKHEAVLITVMWTNNIYRLVFVVLNLNTVFYRHSAALRTCGKCAKWSKQVVTMTFFFFIMDQKIDFIYAKRSSSADLGSVRHVPESTYFVNPGITFLSENVVLGPNPTQLLPKIRGEW